MPSADFCLITVTITGIGATVFILFYSLPRMTGNVGPTCESAAKPII